MIKHHPETELLLDYATGSLSEPVSLVVASHACWCADCRGQVAKMETLGGAFLLDLGPEAIGDDLLAATLAKLDDTGGQSAEPAQAAHRFDKETRRLIPPPVRRYLDGNVSDLRWRWQGPVLREARLAVAGPSYRASLFRLKPGASPPEHGHAGNEYTMVLDGSFTDDGDLFGAGDFVHYSGLDSHLQTADMKDGCVCLTVLDAPVRLSGPFGRFLNPFLRF